MSRRVGCPYPKWADAYVELPDEWLGEHVGQRDEAIAKAEKRGVISPTLISFAVALALAENWGNIPGLDGPPDKWDFKEVPAKIIAWMNEAVVEDFVECFKVPKGSLSPSPDGSKNQQTRGDTKQQAQAVRDKMTDQDPDLDPKEA